MGNKKQITYIYDDSEEKIVKFQEKNPISWGLISVIIVLLILSGALTQRFIFAGNILEGMISKTSTTIMWIIIVIAIIGTVIFGLYTRRTQLEFAKYLGYEEGSDIPHKKWGKIIGKKLKKECKNEDPNAECDIDEITQRKYKEFKELREKEKLNINDSKEKDYKEDVGNNSESEQDLTAEEVSRLIKSSANFHIDK